MIEAFKFWMLKLFFHIVLLIPIFLAAQVNFVNRSLTDSSLKIIYSGVGNIIEVKNYTFTRTTRIGVSNGEILPLDKNKIKIIPKSGFGECLISVENLHTDSEEYSQVFRIDTFTSQLKIRLAGVKDSVATIHQILANPFLISEIPGSYYKNPVHIPNFTGIFIGANFDSVRTNAIEQILTKEQVNLVNLLCRGDKILFEVYYFWPDGRRRRYVPFTITIK